jgi:hypothetical protein
MCGLVEKEAAGPTQTWEGGESMSHPNAMKRKNRAYDHFRRPAAITLTAFFLSVFCLSAERSVAEQQKAREEAAGAAAAGASEQPDAAAILREVRKGQAAINQTLSGKLRMGSRSIPYRMSMEGPSIRFEFPSSAGDEPRSASLKFGEKDVTLQVQSAAGKLKNPVFEDELFEMGVTYEDLAMRFLYWPKAVIEGEERMLLVSKCWKIRILRPPGSRSLYKEVLVWVSQSNGAFLKSEAYGDDGALLRRMTVRSLQSIGQGTTLRQLRVESPSQKPMQSPTYLDVDGENAAQAPR